MPARRDIKRIMVIGSGPIVIGQAAEFDYAGTQACLALREEGYEVVLVNSNPATIMTDVHIADKVYMEPLTLEYVAKIIRYERPDAIVPGLGGQTGLNLAMQLSRKGVLDECRVELLGTRFESIEKAEDRELFKELCAAIGEPTPASDTTDSVEGALAIAREIGYPVIVRPAFTLGGTGGGFADDENELKTLAAHGLGLSPVNQVLIEKSIKGYKEIEFEVMRDSADSAISICSMENVDPVGVHTGDSIVVAPAQTLTDAEYQRLRSAALRIIRALGIEGGCNVQFAQDTESDEYYVIEVNPRVSRSSALASKATGYPIARVTTKIAVGLTLDEIDLGTTLACCEPAVDYVVAKAPRFAFDKLPLASNALSTQMKATGEVMSIGRTLEEAFLKAFRSLETDAWRLRSPKLDAMTTDELYEYIREGRDDRMAAICVLLRRGERVSRICEATAIDALFVDKLKNIVDLERLIADKPLDGDMLRRAKRMNIGDRLIAELWGTGEGEIYKLRKKLGIMPVYKSIDTSAGDSDFAAPYFYSTYESENESQPSEREKIIVLGAGPIRIGQGVEFDYSTVHAVWTIREAGYEAIIINNNPETVSTDYTTSDKLYFEPLTVEDVMNIVELEQPKGVIVTLGGQTAINLAEPLAALGVPIIGTQPDAIARAEDRDLFEEMLERLEIPKPAGHAVTDLDEGARVAASIGYPVLVRPSYVLGGRAMEIVGDEASLHDYFKTAVELGEDKPVLVDKYVEGKELEVDAACDGERVFVPGIMEHVERTGIHSGDSISVYPTFSVSDKVKKDILDYTERLGLATGIKGLYNIQFIADSDDNVFVIEVNPRSSRTVPFISKATGAPLADIGTSIMLGKTLAELGYHERYLKEKDRYYVKAPAFSFSKLTGMDAYLSPEMKSTGEAIGYDRSLNRALYKALQSSGMRVSNYGTIFVTLADKDKLAALPLISRFYQLGFNIEATRGTAAYLKEHGIRTRERRKISEGSDEIPDAIRRGYVSYIINTRNLGESDPATDGAVIRSCAAENNVTLFTSLDTVRVLLDVLEEITLCISTIDAQ